MGFRDVLKRREVVQSVTTAELSRAPQSADTTEVALRGERGIGERAEASLDRLPLEERPRHIARRIQENIRRLIAEKHDYATNQAPFLTHAASMVGQEISADPMMIDTRLAIWEQLAMELAGITELVDGVVAEQRMLETRRADLFRELDRHDAGVAQATSWLQQIAIKIAREENGVQQPDPLYGKIKDLPDHADQVAQRQQVLLDSPQARGGLIAAIEHNEIDQAKNKDARYHAARAVSNFIRNRYNPELERCNKLRADSLQRTNEFLEWFHQRLRNSHALAGVGFTQQEIEEPQELEREREETSGLGRRAVSGALSHEGILDEILGVDEHVEPEVLTGSIVEPQHR